jgi:hypothetical protein
MKPDQPNSTEDSSQPPTGDSRRALLAKMAGIAVVVGAPRTTQTVGPTADENGEFTALRHSVLNALFSGVRLYRTLWEPESNFIQFS